ncbi:YdcH family protein [Chitinivorax sp. B]|uniref:YdcH family protein n=1 Tax=Chitinivorax sp. B TaxID=2502235 RepID=UPI0010F6D5DC|nr:YdcH family protein [Chitinivorax sp. B]
MHIEHHDLAKEFPEFKAEIHQMKAHDAHFARLFMAYQDIDKRICRLEDDGVPVSDELLEGLKKQRLQLKDELYQMLRSAAPAQA